MFCGGSFFKKKIINLLKYINRFVDLNSYFFNAAA